MSALTSSELAAMRSEVEGMFDQLLDIYRGTKSEDNYGGWGEGTPVLAYSGIACEVYPGAAHVVDVQDEAQLVDSEIYTISLPVGTDIQKRDKVVITTANNLELYISVVHTPESQQLQMLAIGTKEVLNG